MSLNNVALKMISALIIAGSIVISAVLFVNSRDADRKAEVISDCFNVSTYTATNEESKSVVKEPVLRFFKTCMEINGYGSNYTFHAE